MTSRTRMKIGGAIVLGIALAASSPFVSIAFSIAMAPEIIKGDFPTSEGEPGFLVECTSPDTKWIWEKELFTSGKFYEVVSARYPVGSSAPDLEKNLKEAGFEVEQCEDATFATYQMPTTIFSDVRADIAWRQDKNGKITEIGVQYINRGI